MILTVTLNPAIDKTVEINEFQIGTVNRVSSMRVDAGGKGANVSKVIKSLGGRSVALGVLAGKNGEYIKDYLNFLGIDNNFVFVNGETRVNLKIVDRINKSNTDINEPGAPILEEDLRRLDENILNSLGENSIVVFSGSVPAGVPRDIYKVLIEKVKKYGAKTILDADGDLLKEGIQAGPYMVKPNINELERFYNERLSNTADIIRAGRGFFKYGVEQVVVSLGKDGALFISEEAVVLAHGLNVEVGSTVGAGDSMVAALALSLESDYSLEEAVRLSVAASAANVMTSGTQPAELNQILELKKRVELEYIK